MNTSYLWIALLGLPFLPNKAARSDMAPTSVHVPLRADWQCFAASSWSKKKSDQ